MLRACANATLTGKDALLDGFYQITHPGHKSAVLQAPKRFGLSCWLPGDSNYRNMRLLNSSRGPRPASPVRVQSFWIPCGGQGHRIEGGWFIDIHLSQGPAFHF